MSTRNFSITTLIVVFNLVMSVVSLVEFSKSFKDVNKITSKQGVTLEACEAGCERRKHCKSALYNKRASYCVFAGNDRSVDPVVPSIGTVLISGFHRHSVSSTSDVMETCGNMTCVPLETCIADSTGERTCKVTECGEPPPHQSVFTILQGNMYSVKNKLVLRDRWDGPFEKTITCGDNGEWDWDRHDTSRDYCRDFVGTMTASSGLYMLEPSMQVVYCDMDTDGGHWLVFQRRMDGSVDFYRDWTGYVTGFGILTGEFWFGLDALYNILLSGVFELRVDLEDFSGQHRYAKYSTFKLEGPQDNYRLWVSGYSGDAGDSLEWHNGMQFTTRDADHDMSSDNCAHAYKGAWWYNECHWSNLNGLYYHGGGQTTGYAININWKYWLGFYRSLKTTEMKLRRIS